MTTKILTGIALSLAIFGSAALASAQDASAENITLDAWDWTCVAENNSGGANCESVARVFCTRYGYDDAVNYRLRWVDSNSVGHFRYIVCSS